MPCWVVPVIAAELWGVSLEHLLLGIADGTVPSRTECGFVVVDVAPESTVYERPRRAGPPPPTYVVVNGASDEVPEVPALIPDRASEPVLVPAEVVSESFDGEIPPLDEEEDDKPISNWRQVRSSVGRTRMPPARVPPVASAA